MFYKVMIIEDEDMIRKGIKFGFDWQSVNCHVVADTYDSKKAIDLIAEHKPNILLVDINLPIMGGLEIIAKTYANYDYTPIIISGYSDFDYAQKAIQLGVVSYITKPIDNQKLKKAIEVAIQEQKNKRIINRDLFIRKQMNERNVIDEKYHKTIKDDLVREIIEVIENNYPYRMLLSELTSEIGYSESTINDRLKKTLGTTFNQYLNQYRIHKAIQVLNKDKLINLEYLGASVGIPNYKHFARVFKKHTGYSPKEFAINLDK